MKEAILQVKWAGNFADATKVTELTLTVKMEAFRNEHLSKVYPRNWTVETSRATVSRWTASLQTPPLTSSSGADECVPTWELIARHLLLPLQVHMYVG